MTGLHILIGRIKPLEFFANLLGRPPELQLFRNKAIQIWIRFNLASTLSGSRQIIRTMLSQLSFVTGTSVAKAFYFPADRTDVPI